MSAPVASPRLPFTAAVAQFAPQSDAAANLAEAAVLVREAAARGAELVVLPEYTGWFVDPLSARLAAGAEPVEGPFTTALQALAEETGTVVVAGFVERIEGSSLVYNTLAAVAADGVRAVYRKQHLYDAFGARESAWITPGPMTPPQTFEVGGVRCGMMTCYDLRFPEVARTLVDAGTDVVLVPAEWVRGPRKEHHWVTLLQARAIENTVYVLAADHTPPSGVGASMIVDPEGVVAASLGARPGVATAPIDPVEIDRVREVNPALRLRRMRVAPLGQ